MSWLMVGGAVVMGGLTAGSIGSKNSAAVKAFNATNAAYTLQQQENNVRMYEATEEAKRAGAMGIIEEKAVISETVGKESIRRGEGATAGVSVGRGIQKITISTEQAINKELTNQRRSLINMWQQNEQTNAQIQQAKVDARNKAKAGMTTGVNSLLAITQGAISGGSLGHSLSGAMATTTSNTNTLNMDLMNSETYMSDAGGGNTTMWGGN